MLYIIVLDEASPPSYRRGREGLERMRNLPEVIRLASGGAHLSPRKGCSHLGLLSVIP